MLGLPSLNPATSSWMFLPKSHTARTLVCCLQRLQYTPTRHSCCLNPPPLPGVRLVFALTGGGPTTGSVETVLIPMRDRGGSRLRYTACLSSQVGCAMNCQVR